MKLTKLFSLLLCCVCLVSAVVPAQAQKKDKNAPATDTPPPTPYSQVRRDTLLNGLQIVTFDRPGEPLVKCDIIVRAGAIFDLTGKTGLAALTQASLLAVNPNLKEEVASLQAKIDWGVNSDTTWFHVETPANTFPQVFEILARLLVVDAVRPEALKLAQQAQLERAKAQTLTPAQQAEQAFFSALYGVHPYGHNVEGDATTIAAIKQGDVYDFFRRFYLANNASVVISGNISQERVMQTFKVFFGGWVKGQIVPATFRQPAQVAQVRLIKVEAPAAPNVELRGGLISVKHTDPDFLVTEVMAKLLHARLKAEAGSLANDFSVTAQARSLAGPLWFAASAPADKAPEFSRAATEAFAALAATPVAADALAAAKTSLSGEYFARSVEHYLREIETYQLPRSYPLTVGKKIEDITAADVQRVAKRLFDANALTVVALGKVNETFKATP